MSKSAQASRAFLATHRIAHTHTIRKLGLAFDSLDSHRTCTGRLSTKHH